MPSSCTPSVSPDVALFPGSAGSRDATSAAAINLPGTTTEAFDSLLTQEGTITAPVVNEETPTLGNPAPLTAEQLAFLAALAMPAPVPTTPMGKEVATGDCRAGWVRTDGTGMSIPELLGQGVERLSYAAAPTPADQVRQPEAQAASEGALSRMSGTGSSPSAQRGVAEPSPAQSQLEMTRSSERLSSPVRPIQATQAGVLVSPSPVVSPAAVAPAAPADGYTGPSALQTAASVQGTASDVSALALSPTAKTRAIRATPPLGEKNAVSSRSPSPAGGFPSIDTGKMQSEVAAQEQLATSASVVGTSAANWGKPMPQDSRNAPELSTQPGTLAVAQEPGSMSLGTTTPAASVSQPASQAMEMVREIRDIAEGLWQVERNSVEVQFDFGSREHLSVRVEYRDGVVQATFKTDSPELRDAIAREWHQSAGTQEARPYRVADPVFTSSGFSFSGDASRHQRSQEQAVPFEQAHAFVASRGGPSAPSSPAVLAPVQRPASTGHLHAIV